MTSPETIPGLQHEAAEMIYAGIADGLSCQEIAGNILLIARTTFCHAQTPTPPIAWRWRRRGNACWIYNPELQWVEVNKDDPDLEFEPLYAVPVSSTNMPTVTPSREGCLADEHCSYPACECPVSHTSSAPKPGDPASVGAIAQTFFDEDYHIANSYELAAAMLKHWDVRWKEPVTLQDRTEK